MEIKRTFCVRDFALTVKMNRKCNKNCRRVKCGIMVLVCVFLCKITEITLSCGTMVGLLVVLF